MLRVIGRRAVEVPLPPRSKFDSMKEEDLYLALEGALSNSTRLATSFPHSAEAPAELQYLQIELETALAVVQAIRRKQ